MDKTLICMICVAAVLPFQVFADGDAKRSQSLPQIVGSYDPMGNWKVCRTVIGGNWELQIYDADDPRIAKNTSWKERILGVGSKITCPAFVTLRAMTPELSEEQRAPFCLSLDIETGLYSGYSVGHRDAYLNCSEPAISLCERVSASKDAAIAIAGFGAGAAAATAGAQAATAAAGVSAVAHSSGAVILTGSAGYIAGTIGTVGATALSILTAPATLATATITVVAVGGAVYVCSDPIEHSQKP